MSPETDKNALIEKLKSTDCNRVPLVREVLADLDHSAPISSWPMRHIPIYLNPFREVRNGGVTPLSACRAELLSRLTGER